MKEIDVTKNVMGKVMAYEKTRIAVWLRAFLFLFGAFVFVIIVGLLMAAYDMVQKETFTLFALLGEDFDIIIEFWQDTLSVLWEELPRSLVYIVATSLMGLILLLLVTGRKRTLIRKKIDSLAKYAKISNNNVRPSMNKIWYAVIFIVLLLGGIIFLGKGNVQPSLENSPATSIDKDVTQETPAAPIESGMTLTISSPQNGSIVSNPSVTVRGKTKARAEVFINEKDITADANGNFTAEIALDDGENVIVVFANDAEGNTAEQELIVTYETAQ